MRKIFLLPILFILYIVQVFGQIDFEQLKKIKMGIESDNSVNELYSRRSDYIINDYGDAPGWSWTNEFGGTGVDYSNDIIVDENGNFYITGGFSGEISIEGNNYISEGDWDGIVAKFDISGNFIWVTQFFAAGYGKVIPNDIDIDTEGNIFITGYYTGIATIGDYTLPDNGSQSLFFVKLNNNGEILLAKNNGANQCTGLIVNTDDSGNIFVLGTDGAFSGWEHSSLVLKYSSSGDLLESFYTNQAFNNMVVLDNSVYFTGAITEAGYIDTVWVEPTNSGNLFFAKSDLSFSFEWVEVAESTGSGFSNGNSLFYDDNGNFYISGNKKGEMSFGDIAFEYNSYGFLLKISSSGIPMWGQDVFINNSSIKVDITGGAGKLFLKYVFNSTYLYEYDVENGNIINNTTYYSHKINRIYYCSENHIIGATGTKNDLIYLLRINDNFAEVWYKQFGGNSGNARVSGMVSDNNANAYIYGYTTNDIDYFGQVQDKGLFLAKHNSSGDVIWKRTLLCDDYSLSSKGSYISIDTVNSYIYITGTFYSELTIPGYTVLTPAISGSVFIIKYDFDGNFILAIQEDFDGSDLCLSIDNAGNTLFSGVFLGEINIGGMTLISDGSMDIFIAKYGTDGALLWAVRGGGESNEYSGLVATDSDNNIYFTGEFISENITFGNSQISLLEGDGNIVFAKINPEGEVLWLTSKAGSSIYYGDWFCWPTGIKTDSEGYIYIKGCHTDSTYFDDFLLLSPDYEYGYFIGKFDPDGNTIWVNSIRMHMWASDYNQMDVDSQGNIYMGAQVRNYLEFGDDYVYYPSEGMMDIFIAKYQTNGELEWVKTAQGGGGTVGIQSVAILDVENIMIGGHYSGFLSFGDEQLYSNNTHGFVAKLTGENVIIENSPTYNLFKVSPNPVRKYIVIDFAVESDIKSLSIVSVSGKTVCDIHNLDGRKRLFINAAEFSKGIYLVKVKANKGYQVRKIIIN